MKTKVLYIFWICVVVEIGALFAQIAWAASFAKVLIVPSLILFYITQSRKPSVPVVAALMLSWIGDVLLLEPSRFIAGLVAFLLAHIALIFAYKQHRSKAEANNVGVHRARLAFPIIVAGSGLVFILFPVLDDLKIPVMIYACVIVVMVIAAIQRLGSTSTKSFVYTFAGATLFLISDSLLALNKFLIHIPSADVWIMSTYACAQFAIVVGLLFHTTNSGQSEDKASL